MYNPEGTLRIVGTDNNFSKWQVFYNNAEITRDISGILIEFKRGCLPLISLRCNAHLEIQPTFTANIELLKLVNAT